ncbi:MAG TPA: DNA polymerase III subunit gamma/tau [bacterium]|nr:DNA polymerase III subunit gamma/tau [bacterium]
MAQQRGNKGGKAKTGDDGGATGRSGYQVVARRFRPQKFEEMVGQDEVLQSLRVALQQDRVPHAFVFAGSRGVGKTTSARILARCLNCERGPTPDPCGSCDACRSILDGSNADVIEMDAASNRGVDDVRQLRESVAYSTMNSRYRVVILDEVHMFTKEAFNAFLKTLEEPPPKVVFVLATTELHKLPDTIRSRCQVLRFRRVGEIDLQKRLRMIAEKEGVALADDVLAEIAASVRGGVRDAETALERVLPLARELGEEFDLAAYRTLTARVGTDAVVDVVAALLRGEAGAGLHFAHELRQHGTDEREALGEIVEVLRWLLLLKIDGDDSVLVTAQGALRERLQRLAQDTDTARLDAMIAAGVLGRDRLKRIEDRGAVFEVALVRMAQAGAMPTLAQLLAQVQAGGLPAPPTSPASPAPPARPVAPPAGADDLKARTLARCADRGMLQATLDLCRFDGPDDSGVVVVTLESPRKMHRDRLRSPVVAEDVKKAIREAAGRDVKVELRVPDDTDDTAEAAGAAPKRPAAAQQQPGPRTSRVLDKFGGRVVQVDPPDRVSKPPQ